MLGREGKNGKGLGYSNLTEKGAYKAEGWQHTIIAKTCSLFPWSIA